MQRKIALLALVALLGGLLVPARQAFALALVVNTTSATSGGGLLSLRDAITQANASAGSDTITFNIPTSDSGFVAAGGYWSIDTSGSKFLPIIAPTAGGSGSIALNGSSQPGGRGDGGPKIEITGNNVASACGFGFFVTSPGNTIQGFIVNGHKATCSNVGAVTLSGTNATGNTVSGNYIGTNFSGTAAVPNEGGGIAIVNGAKNNTIGGSDAQARNVISGNGSTTTLAPQVLIAGQSPPLAGQELTGNVVANNFIGTNAAGTAALPGASHGVLLSDNALSNTVGPGNLISGNAPANTANAVFGVAINGSTSSGTPSNVVKGNFIGTNVAGTGALPNGSGNSGGGGVLVTQNGQNVIGGSAVVDRNVISGHTTGDSYGVFLGNRCSASTPTPGNSVVNNYIGLNAAGTAALPNRQGVGIGPFNQALVGSCNNVVGPNNVISGNSIDGVRILGVGNASVTDANQTRNNRVIGNLIGTNSAGSAAIANQGSGVYITRHTIGNTIGGAAASDRNTISGNTSAGVRLGVLSLDTVSDAFSPFNNTVAGNYIGTTSAGTGSLGNGEAGVLLERNAKNNVVGPGNLIAGQSGASAVGVQIINNSAGASTSGNQIKGNTIGLNGAPNTNGVRITGSATGNTIGSTLAGPVADGNVINFNTFDGVVILAASGNLAVNNQLFNNGANGVQVNNGSTNRLSRNTTGGNNSGIGIRLTSNGNANRSKPTNLGTNAGNIVGTVPSCPGCTVEIFSNGGLEPNEGNKYLATVTSDAASGFSVPVATLQAAGCDPNISATVTDASGNTSEFSDTLAAVCVVAAAGLEFTPQQADRTIAAGGFVDYEYTLRNSGAAAGNFTIEYTSSNGWDQMLTPTSYTIPAGESRPVTVRVTVPANTTFPNSNTSTVTARLGAASAADTVITSVARVSGVTFTPDRTGITPISPPGTATYRHTLTNTGNSQDVFDLVGSSATAGVTFSFSPASPITLAPNASIDVDVTVNIPATVGNVPFVNSSVVATSQADPSKTATVNQSTPVKLIPQPELLPATRADTGKPGASVIYPHTLKNVGGAAGTFNLTASLPAAAVAEGWTVSIQQPSPNTFGPAPSAGRPVTLTVNIPAYDPAKPTTYSGAQVAVTLTATGTPDNATSVAIDTTTVALAPALTFTPTPLNKSAAPGQVLDYAHTIQNTGNGQETFAFTATHPAGWNAVVLDATTLQTITSVTLARGASRNLLVRVTIPIGSPVGTVGPTTVVARASSDASVSASVIDTTTIVAAAVPQLSAGQAKSTDPGVAVTFDHTITNIGNVAGTFIYAVEGLPNGWTSSVTQAGVATLNPNGSDPRSLSVVITPAADALAQSYSVTLRATANDANAATISVVDTVTINQRAALEITPTYNDLRDPGVVVTYTHVLKNAGNFTDTINLSASASQPWAVTLDKMAVVLAPSASTPLVVTLTIPPGVVAGLVNNTLITATSSLGEQLVITNTATISQTPGLTLTPAVLEGAGEATEPVLFRYTLFNSGSVPQTYTLSTTPPSGWTATVVTPTVRLLPGERTEVRLIVTAPAGTPNSTVANTLLRAVSDFAPFPEAQVIARLQVGPAFRVLIEPDNANDVLPGRVYRYAHTVTNIGLFTDTVVLSSRSLLGWETSVSPGSLTLAPQTSATVTVTLLIPTSAEAGVVDKTEVTATSTSRSDVFDIATNTSTVLRVVAVEISPELNRTVAAGDPAVEFLHQVVNIGNGADSFTITASSARGWPVTVAQTQTVALAPGFSYPVQVQVSIPAGTPLGTTDTITVRATSDTNPAVSDELQDTIGTPPVPQANPNPPGLRIYLPIVVKQ